MGSELSVLRRPSFMRRSTTEESVKTLRTRRSTNTAAFRFHWRFDRRYHSDDCSYILPNDEAEMDRLDQEHYLYRITLGDRNYLAPLVPSQVKQVLDVGCGTGIWVLEMASEFPEASFIGVDFSPVFPYEILPVNTDFMLADVLDGFLFPDCQFDYVHQRGLSFGIPSDHWPSVCAELYRICAPGGWCELVETDGQNHSVGTLGNTINRYLRSVMLSRRLHPEILVQLDQYFTNAGFINVKRKIYRIYHGQNAQDPTVGEHSLRDWCALVDGILPWVDEAAGWTVEDVKDFKAQWRQEANDMGTYWQVVVVVGQRPLDDQ